MERCRWRALVLLVMLSCAAAGAEETPRWQCAPGVLLVKHFPGASLDGSWASTYQYAGTSLLVNARCTRADAPNVALTFGGGVCWFYEAADSRIITSPGPTDRGIGSTLHREDFMVYPLTAGVQFVLPLAAGGTLMAFAGVEGAVNFISARVDIGQQIKPGFSGVAGFVIKSFEFGIRYTHFSDMRNLGAHVGLRFAPFPLL